MHRSVKKRRVDRDQYIGARALCDSLRIRRGEVSQKVIESTHTVSAHLLWRFQLNRIWLHWLQRRLDDQKTANSFFPKQTDGSHSRQGCCQVSGLRLQYTSTGSGDPSCAGYN